MSKPYQHPKDGYVINDSQYGSIYIGEDSADHRQRQVELHSASDAAVKLFKDGGFEISSQPTAKLKDNILSRAKNGLTIVSESDLNGGITIDAGSGEITLRARSIKFESTANDRPMVIRSEHNLNIEAGDTLKIKGDVVAIGAETRMLLRSPGPIYINSDAGVTIIEPKISLAPTNLLSFVQSLATNIFGF
jgi:hypothetical protein